MVAVVVVVVVVLVLLLLVAIILLRLWERARVELKVKIVAHQTVSLQEPKTWVYQGIPQTYRLKGSMWEFPKIRGLNIDAQNWGRFLS